MYTNAMTDLSMMGAPPLMQFDESMQNPVQRAPTPQPGSDEQTKQRKTQAKRPYGYGNVAKRVRDMEIMSKSKVAKGAKEPPTVEELQQIVADIRRGLY
jgi:hypothetical protein